VSRFSRLEWLLVALFAIVFAIASWATGGPPSP
jgi:hypothetical protein